MTERLWKLFCGSFAREHRGEMFLKSFVHGEPRITVLTVGQSKGSGQIFFELRGEIDTERVFADGSYIRAHPHASGARIGQERAIGKSRGGTTPKIHMAADAHGNPVGFEITGGEVHDAEVADSLISKAGMNPVIPRKSNSKKLNPEFDAYLYKLRHPVENLFARLKHFRSIATRYEKLARHFKAMVFLACTFIWLKIK